MLHLCVLVFLPMFWSNRVIWKCPFIFMWYRETIFGGNTDRIIKLLTYNVYNSPKKLAQSFTEVDVCVWTSRLFLLCSGCGRNCFA